MIGRMSEEDYAMRADAQASPKPWACEELLRCDAPWCARAGPPVSAGPLSGETVRTRNNTKNHGIRLTHGDLARHFDAVYGPAQLQNPRLGAASAEVALHYRCRSYIVVSGLLVSIFFQVIPSGIPIEVFCHSFRAEISVVDDPAQCAKKRS
jgi:hypothetical protein